MTAPVQPSLPGPPPVPDTAPTPAPQAQAAPTAFNEARSHAQQESCSSNLKQIALGMLMYAQDYDERFPPPSKWHSGTNPYVRNEGVFQCLSDSKFVQSSYAMNRNLGSLAMLDITRPAETVMNFESGLHIYNAFDLKGDVGASLAHPSRHPNGNNFAFADGHVKAFDRSPERAWWTPQASTTAPRGSK